MYHHEKYHELVLDIMRAAEKGADAGWGTADEFIFYFREGIVNSIREKPNILNFKGWR